MKDQQQQDELHEEKPIIHIEGPSYTETQWTVSVSIGPHHRTFYGETEEEAHKQMEQYIDQQITELEKFRSRLRELLGKPKRNLWPDKES